MGEVDLGDEYEAGLCLADTATAIVADEAKASDACGADILVATSSISYPFKGIGAHRTSIIHGLSNYCSTDEPR